MRQIKEFPGNPRKISGDALMALGESLTEFGSLDGFVVNISPNKYENCIISGNQKNRHVNLTESEINIFHRYDEPTATGTVAVGFVVFRGEYFPYREVVWSEEKCEIGNIRANNYGGENDPELLDFFDREVLLAGGVDIEFERAMQLFREQYDHGVKMPEPPDPENLVGEMKNKAAVMKITFNSPEDLQAAEPDISAILDRFPGSFFSVSAGQA